MPETNEPQPREREFSNQFQSQLKDELERELHQQINKQFQGLRSEVRAMIRSVADELTRELAKQIGSSITGTSNGGLPPLLQEVGNLLPFGDLFSDGTSQSIQNLSKGQQQVRNYRNVQQASRHV